MVCNKIVIEDAVRKWHSRWCLPLAEHRGPGRFGETRYWEERYQQRGKNTEWFFDADIAARSAARLYASRSQSIKTNLKNIRVLHLGCGTSLLGLKIFQKLEDDYGISIETVVNTDCSSRALERLEELTCIEVSKYQDPDRYMTHQQYYCWDATQSTCIGNNIHDFHLLLDKGTLDALQFAGSDPLNNYFTTIRSCISRNLNLNPMYLHWSDDDPEMKMDLLTAAFPSSLGWHISCSQEEIHDDDSTTSKNILFGWTYYRYTITNEDGNR